MRVRWNGIILRMDSQFLAVDVVAHVDLKDKVVKLVIRVLREKQDRKVPMDHKVCQVNEVIWVQVVKHRTFTFRRVLKDQRAFLALLANQV